MKNWLYIIYIGLFGALVSSCQQSLDEEVQIPSASGKAQISFTIALDDIESRATWEENEGSTSAVVGSEQENAIDLTSEDGLKVFVYSTNGILLGEVTNKEVRKIDTNEYKFNGQLVIENLTTSTLQCRLMVYANCIESDETFDFDAEYIPMWGVKETTLQLAKGELTQLTEPIYLLRSMAKVEVKLDESIAEDFNMTSVLVDKYNTTGYVLPSYQTLVDTENMDPEQVFNPNASLAEEHLLFAKVENEDAFYVYLPEYDNANPATLSVVIDGKPYPIEFKNYVDGKATGDNYNIVRNHIYQYTITSVTAESHVEVANVRYQSMPWNDVNNGNLNFGNGSGDVMN
jgi:hypothetical protein